MMDYTQIAEQAGMPIIATVFSALKAFPGGPQTGIYGLCYAPGNCIGIPGSSPCSVMTIWPGTAIEMAGDEANDNHLGTVVWN